MERSDIAVYLFTGFLEAGKTVLIQETLEDADFNAGEKTLIISCEEGIEEYDPTSFSSQNVAVESIDTLSQLNPDKLAALQRKHGAVRIMIEYNGMWMLDDLYNAFPENWYIYQEIMLVDSTTFENYNANMRSLVVDKLSNCELVVFNRFDPEKHEMEAFHKVVRGISRSANIAYELNDRTIIQDTIEDPLPFDLEADVVEIADRDYAIWYRDMSEEMEKYEGKTLRFKGIVARDPGLPASSFVIGRHVMTCCIDDVAYRGLICEGKAKYKFENRDWVIVTAVFRREKHKLYKGYGPILHIVSVEECEPLPREEQLATFY